MRYVGRDDLALLVSEVPATTAALFTTNKVKSAHVLFDQALLSRTTTMRAVVINSGSANACTGEAGIAHAEATAHAAERLLELPQDSVMVMSTGVIGVPLNMEKLVHGITEASERLDAACGPSAALAIMTTDTRSKQCAVRLKLPDGGETTHIGGMAKGSGMIHPNMATMLCTITTDVRIEPSTLDAALRYVNERSFHCITVDGDTSTNDTIAVLANGLADNAPITSLDSPDGRAFVDGLLRVAQHLAREVARDGEGATRFVTIQVKGAPTDAEARQVGMSVARSPLVKTALFGADPNWGRLLCAIGYSGVEVDPNRVSLHFGQTHVLEEGLPLEFDEQQAHDDLSKPEVTIDIDLHLGEGTGTVWTCDFSHGYISINAEYRT
jgi:glutamate N-acetyltransferase/amino-acid N-acetyltransferase